MTPPHREQGSGNDDHDRIVALERDLYWTGVLADEKLSGRDVALRLQAEFYERDRLTMAAQIADLKAHQDEQSGSGLGKMQLLAIVGAGAALLATVVGLVLALM